MSNTTPVGSASLTLNLSSLNVLVTAKDQLSSAQDPRYYINGLAISPNLKLMQELCFLFHEKLDKKWLKSFISLGGLYSFSNCLQSFIKKPTEAESQLVDKVMDCLLQIPKALGPEIFLDYKDMMVVLLDVITCTPSYPNPRRLATKLLNQIARFSQECCELVLEWGFSVYQRVHHEPLRFTHFIASLKLEVNDHLKSTMIKFLETLKAEKEYSILGLDDYIRELSITTAGSENKSEKLQKQISKFERKDDYQNFMILCKKLYEARSSATQIDVVTALFNDLIDKNEKWEALIAGYNVSHERTHTSIFGEFGQENDLQKGILVQCAPRKYFKKKEKKKQTHNVLDMLIGHLLKNGTKVENIFKTQLTPQQNNSKEELKKLLLKNDGADLLKYDVHVIARILMDKIKELSEARSDLISSLSQINPITSSSIKEFLIRTSIANRNFLNRSMELLWLISKSAKVNKMNTEQLSICFLPIIFGKDTEKVENQSDGKKKLLYIMIKNYPTLFDVSLKENWQDEMGCMGSDDEMEKRESRKEVVIKENYQQRKNPLTHKWGKVYLVLKDRNLQFYYTSDDFKRGKKPIGVIPLAYAICDKEDRKGHEYCYSIFSQGKTTLFESETEHDRKEWIAELKKVISGAYLQA